MYLSRDNVVAHIVREIFSVATVASNSSWANEICRLFKSSLIDGGCEFLDGLCVEGERHERRLPSSFQGFNITMWSGPRDVWF